MKLINKFILALSLVFALSACENVTDLDLLDNPNAVTPDKAGVDFLYNNIQLTFRNVLNETRAAGQGLTRQTNVYAYTYGVAYAQTTYNFIWSSFYAGMLPDIDALLTLAEERGLDIYAGTAKIMQAYAMMVMVDWFGDIPYTEAGQGTDIISPKADPGSDVYAAAMTLLDEAIADLDGTKSARPASDIFYDGDPASWITLANTLKLRAMVTTRLIDGSANASQITALANGDIIDENDENFEWKYSNQRTNPNSRHPQYNNFYENDDGDYIGTWMMWKMLNDYEMPDPRMRFYFFRQERPISLDNVNVFGCHFSDFPNAEEAGAQLDHYFAIDPDMPYCVASVNDGYYGRDHLNNEGIPPDGGIRTAWGLYPAGGQFDDNINFNVQNIGTDGALGEGIAPYMQASWVDFMIAEAALTVLSDPGLAREKLESGIRKSIDRTFAFASKVNMSEVVGTNPITGEPVSRGDFIPSAEDVDEYVAAALAAFDANTGDEQLNIVMTEYYKALWGNGVELFNMYRRTGMPLRMQPSLEPGAGPIHRSFLYPPDFVNLNATVDQKADNQVRVFWDDGSAPVY